MTQPKDAERYWAEVIPSLEQWNLNELKGARGIWTPTYNKYEKKSGIYVQSHPALGIIYIGTSGYNPETTKEKGLSDRLWSHYTLQTKLAFRLVWLFRRPSKEVIEEVLVQVLCEEDRDFYLELVLLC
jgi:hypothetical protein